MSHTVKMKVELKDKTALAAALTKLQGVAMGEGTHTLYQGAETGFGFTLPGWRYPLVLKEGGELAYDDYHGYWGKVSDLDRLKEHYAIEAARQAAQSHGWMTEDTESGLVIYHPDGGTLTVRTDGTVDANNFVGSSCASASEVIQMALGTKQEEQLKDSYFAERAHVSENEV